MGKPQVVINTQHSMNVPRVQQTYKYEYIVTCVITYTAIWWTFAIGLICQHWRKRVYTKVKHCVNMYILKT